MDADSNMTETLLAQPPCVYQLVRVRGMEFQLVAPHSRFRYNCTGMRVVSSWPPYRTRDHAGDEKPSGKPLFPGDSMRIGCATLAGTVYCTRAIWEGMPKLYAAYFNASLSIVMMGVYGPVERVISAVARWEVDASFLPHSISHHTFAAVDVHVPVNSEDIGYLSKASTALKSSFTVLRTFTITVWLWISATMMLITLAALLILKIRFNVVDTDAPFDVLGVMLFQSPAGRLATTRALSARVLLGSLLVFAIVVSFGFTGGLVSYLNLPLMGPVIDTNDQLIDALEAGRIKPCLVPFTSPHAVIKGAYTDTLRKVRDAVPDWSPHLVPHLLNCAERVLDGSSVVFLTAIPRMFMMSYYPGTMHAPSGNLVGDVPNGHITPKDSGFKEHFGAVTLRIFEAGILLQEQERSKTEALRTGAGYPPSPPQWLPLGIDDVLVAFAVWATGLVIAFLAFIIELLCWRFMPGKAPLSRNRRPKFRHRKIRPCIGGYRCYSHNASP